MKKKKNKNNKLTRQEEETKMKGQKSMTGHVPACVAYAAPCVIMSLKSPKPRLLASLCA
jgi:hypothetical protein